MNDVDIKTVNRNYIQFIDGTILYTLIGYRPLLRISNHTKAYIVDRKAKAKNMSMTEWITLKKCIVTKRLS